MSNALKPAAALRNRADDVWHAMRSNSSGFSLIEVIVAMFVLATVLGSAAAIVGANERLGRKVEAVGHQDAVAQQALESMRTNADQKNQCYAGWDGNPGTCTVAPYTVRWPEDGRLYDVQISIEAVDDPIDGTGVNDAVDATGGDADNNVLDHFDVTVTADLQVDANERLADFPAATLVGRLDWGEGQGDGSVKISVCGSVRPERGNNLSECNQPAAAATLDNPTFYVNGVTVTLEPTGDYSNTGAGQSGTSGGFGEINFAAVREGKYRVVVDDTQTFAADNKDTRFFRASPEFVDIDNGEAQQEVNIAMTYEGGVTRVCARMHTETNGGLGPNIGTVFSQWDAAMLGTGNSAVVDDPQIPTAETNIAWGIVGSPVFRTMALRDIEYDPSVTAWQCEGPDDAGAVVDWELYDPLLFGFDGNENKTFMGRNWVQVEQTGAGSPVPGFKPTVTLHENDCNGPLVGSPAGELPSLRGLSGPFEDLMPGADADNPGLSEPLPMHYDRWTADTHALCLDITARAANAVQCVQDMDPITNEPLGTFDDPRCEDSGLVEEVLVCVDPPPPGACPCSPPGPCELSVPGSSDPGAGTPKGVDTRINWYYGGNGWTSDTTCIQHTDETVATNHPWTMGGIVPGVSGSRTTPPVLGFTSAAGTIPSWWSPDVATGGGGALQMGGADSYTGNWGYYSTGFESWHYIWPGNDRFWCNGEVSFAMSASLMTSAGRPYSAADRRDPGNADVSRYWYDDCLQVNYRGHPDIFIRGRIKDNYGFAGTSNQHLNISLAGVIGLNTYGDPATNPAYDANGKTALEKNWQLYENTGGGSSSAQWDTYTGGGATVTNKPGGLPYIDVKLVIDDPVCNYTSNGGTTKVPADPEIITESTPVYAYVDDEVSIPPVLGEEEDSNVVTPTGDGTVEDDNGVTKGGRTL